MKRGPNLSEIRVRELAATKGSDECWNWTGTIKSDGYGTAWFRGRTLGAHRIAYQLLVGSVPDGLCLDHLCRNRSCVNPAHLEPVTTRENILRGEAPPAKFAVATHCIRGHEFSPENTYYQAGGRRACHACSRIKWAEMRARGWRRKPRLRRKADNPKRVPYRGVTESGGRFYARIGVPNGGGKNIALGSFATAEDAARAYDAAVRKGIGNPKTAGFLNFPE